ARSGDDPCFVAREHGQVGKSIAADVRQRGDLQADALARAGMTEDPRDHRAIASRVNQRATRLPGERAPRIRFDRQCFLQGHRPDVARLSLGRGPWITHPAYVEVWRTDRYVAQSVAVDVPEADGDAVGVVELWILDGEQRLPGLPRQERGRPHPIRT